MIAAVDHEQKAVWGYGQSKQEALDHAREELKSKKDVKWNKLEFCHLSKDADMSLDGLGLYRFVKKGTEPTQASLF